MRILITGASGFVGAAVLRKLIEREHEMRVLVRAESSRVNLEGLPVEVVVGDLRDRPSLGHAVRTCEVLYHVAADYRLWAQDPRELYHTNVTGTRNIVLAAADAGMRRIVYTSSVATLGLHPDGAPADEETPVSLDHMIGHYKRSKFLAEQEITRLASERGLPVVIVNPSTPIGPRDVKPTPTGRMVLDAATGRMPAYVDTGLNVVHVDDVAEGHLRAFERGRIGERYILGGHDMTLRQILEYVARITGGKPPRIRLPQGVILPFAYISEAWARVSNPRTPPRLTVAGLRMSKKRMFFTSGKAERELGYRFRPAAQAIEEAIAWFRAQGYA
ncbi:MAG: hopanoid-associated sugar epimerase [Gammaproteobacteria bacterium]